MSPSPSTHGIVPLPSQPAAPSIALLPQVGLLEFEGPDAASFLHGQFSNDVKGLAAGRAQWTSYNSPKGRLLATLLLARVGPDVFRAFVAADICDGLRRRLSMFVMRAKVGIVDASAAGARYGITGPAAGATVASALNIALVPGAAIMADKCTIVVLADGRVVVAATADSADAVARRLQAVAQPAPATGWDYAGIVAGVPQIARATQELFVPQSANWDLVGGIDFQKGCYPGQEIVARMQYLGRLKERLLRFHVDGEPPDAGTRLYSQRFGDQPCGTVVNAAPAPEGGSEMLAVVQWEAAASGRVHLGSHDGPPLAPRELPYVVPVPVAPVRPQL